MSGWLKNVAAKLAALKVIRIFFGKKGANASDIGKEAGRVALANVLYRYFEWILVGITFSLVCLLKYYEIREFCIFLILWIWTLIDTTPGILLNDWLKVDITTREGLRRWLDALYAKSGHITLILLILIEILYCAYEIVWNGPEWFFLFFRSRIAHWPRWGKILLYVAVAGIQMAIWTKIYCLGYESISELVKYYQK